MRKANKQERHIYSLNPTTKGNVTEIPGWGKCQDWRWSEEKYQGGKNSTGNHAEKWDICCDEQFSSICVGWVYLFFPPPYVKFTHMHINRCQFSSQKRNTICSIALSKTNSVYTTSFSFCAFCFCVWRISRPNKRYVVCKERGFFFLNAIGADYFSI